jgi:DNA modification methylase
MATIAIHKPLIAPRQFSFVEEENDIVDYANNPPYKRTYDESLSFKGDPLRQGRHKIHPYPAMLHPLLVDYLIDNYAKKNSVILDPFSGSGVSLLQAGLKGYKSFGFDINPIALLISKAKTANYDLKILGQDIKQVKNDIEKCEKVDVPEIKNIDYWYSKSTQNSLGRIRYCLKNNKYNHADLLKTCFVLVCRDQSYTRNGEFKRYRIKADRLDKKKDETLNKFYTHLNDVLEILKKANQKITAPEHFLDNSENIDKYHLKYDLIITSPPYGDSRTTVAYGEFSSFGLGWVNDFLGDMSIKYNVDKQSVGRKRPLAKNLLENRILASIVRQISQQDTKRSGEVLAFFNEYFIILEKVLNNLEINGRVCFVVGNRRVKGIEVPMDQITAEMMEKYGIKIKEILVRDISNKVMPSANSPTNETGKKDKTMSFEYIIIGNKEQKYDTR